MLSKYRLLSQYAREQTALFSDCSIAAHSIVVSSTIQVYQSTRLIRLLSSNRSVPSLTNCSVIGSTLYPIQNASVSEYLSLMMKMNQSKYFLPIMESILSESSIRREKQQSTLLVIGLLTKQLYSDHRDSPQSAYSSTMIQAQYLSVLYLSVHYTDLSHQPVSLSYLIVEHVSSSISPHLDCEILSLSPAHTTILQSHTLTIYHHVFILET